MTTPERDVATAFHPQNSRDPATPSTGLDADPAEIARLIEPPTEPVAEDDGPIVVMAPRPWSPPAAVVPALLVLLLAGGLMAYRAVAVQDWQGLFTEGVQRVFAQTNPNRPAAEQPVPARTRTEADATRSREAEGTPPDALAVAEPPPGESPNPVEPPALVPPAEVAADEPPVEPEAPDGPKVAAAEPPVPADEADAALDDIRKEAERRRAEQQELAQLKEKIEAEAPPPRQADPRRDHAQMMAMIRELQRRQVEAMEQTLRDMERQQADWIHRALRDFGAFPGGPGLAVPGDDPVFGPLRQRHAEAIERAERDMRQLRERMGRGGGFEAGPIAGIVPPPPPPWPIPAPPRPAPGFDPSADPDEAGDPNPIPPGLVVPEGAQVRTFTGPDGSRGFIMRWGWPPQGGGR